MAAVDGDGGFDGLVAAAGVLGPVGPARLVGPGRVPAHDRGEPHGNRARAAPSRPAPGRRGGASGHVLRRRRHRAAAAVRRLRGSKAAVVRLTENIAAAGIRRQLRGARVHRDRNPPGHARGRPRGCGRRVLRAHHAPPRRGRRRPRRGLRARLVPALCRGRGDPGKLISAQWDPWRDAGFRHRLATEPRPRDAAADRRPGVSIRMSVPVPVAILAGGRATRLGRSRPTDRRRWWRSPAGRSSSTSSTCSREHGVRGRPVRRPSRRRRSGRRSATVRAWRPVRYSEDPPGWPAPQCASGRLAAARRGIHGALWRHLPADRLRGRLPTRFGRGGRRVC